MASSAYADATVATIVTTQAVAVAEPRRSRTRARMAPTSTTRAYVPYVRTWIRTVRIQASAVKATIRPIARQPPPRARSTLSKEAARARYVEMGELAALEQIREDAKALDERAIAVGPFARLDANAVAASDGKTRGAITNLFGSQATYQAETMALALSAGDWLEELAYPDPTAFPSAEAWVDALFGFESARGPQHGSEPTVRYATLWALWLTAVPYGLWSERIARPSLAEHAEWRRRLEDVLGRALEHFGRALREEVTLADLASAVASLVEGAWLNQCLTRRHPADEQQPAATALVRSRAHAVGGRDDRAVGRSRRRPA